MIRSIGDLKDERIWGALACRLSQRARKTGAPVSAAALSGDHLSTWIRAGSLSVSLDEISADPDGGAIGAWGRMDRRLLRQFRMLAERMPDGLSEAILSAADQVGDGPWIVVSSPLSDHIAPTAWRAGIAGALLDASILTWSDMLSDYRYAIGASENLAGGLVIIQDTADTAPVIGPERWYLTGTESNGVLEPGDIRSGEPRNRMETVYGFGALYNRLVRPQDPFSYLDALVRQGPEDGDDPWRLVSAASGVDPEIRSRAVAAMEGVISELSAAGTSPPIGLSGRKIRQVSGIPAAPGRRTGRIRRTSSPDHGETGLVVVAKGELDSDHVSRLPNSVGLVESRGGRGGPGAWLCRRYGIPAVCEVENADWLPDSGTVIVDGDTGIITVVDSGGSSIGETGTERFR